MEHVQYQLHFFEIENFAVAYFNIWIEILGGHE